MSNSTETKKVENWWDRNPFVYTAEGIGERTDPNQLPIFFFDEAERKYKKHSSISTQEEGQPVFSRYINYESLRGRKILDIATGTGFSSVEFARHGSEVTGIDITEYAVEMSKRNFELRSLEGTFLKMDGQQLDFPDNTFDFVCAHGCLMHMPDTNKAVREIYRVLKPGGEVYAWMYHRGWYYWFSVMFVRGILLGKLFKHGFSSLAMTSRYSDGSHIGGNPHTKFYSRRGFRKLFGQADFTDIEVFANYNPNEWAAWPLKSFSLGRFVPKAIQKFLSEKVGFAYSCSIKARKPKGE